MPIKRSTGFTKSVPVPRKLAKFLEIPEGTQLNGPEITKLVFDALKAKNLISKDDGRVFRTNKEVTDVFGVNEEANESNSHKDKYGFNFCTLQKYIANAMRDTYENSDEELHKKIINEKMKDKIMNEKMNDMIKQLINSDSDGDSDSISDEETHTDVNISQIFKVKNNYKPIDVDIDLDDLISFNSK